MGREVSRNKLPDEPGKHSRLWALEDICDVLEKYKGTEVIEGMIPRNLGKPNALNRISITTETFKRMGSLRFLLLRDVNISGSFEQTLEDLRWLTWNGCTLQNFPSEFFPWKLVFLALPCSKLRTMQGLNRVFLNLKDLDMSRSLDLTTTPDFTKLPCLETLDLHGCRSLEDIHTSIGILLKLVSLNLSGCVKLKSLPDTVCNLSALEVLYLDSCKSLKALPEEVGNIKSIKDLIASNLTVSELPDSIGRLSKLVRLLSSGNKNLKALPDTICNLRALEFLDIDYCTSLTALPMELGKMVSLKQLRMKGLAVSEIPNSIQRLHELVDLFLSGNQNLRKIPDSICRLRSLKRLYISGCKRLEISPEKFGHLTIFEYGGRAPYKVETRVAFEKGDSGWDQNIEIKPGIYGVNHADNIIREHVSGCNTV
ncbi:hypothetical protein ACET3Z_006427 [Daucus carota]